MKKPPRNRIVRHVRIRAGDLVPHELNPRTHSDAQRRALEQLYEEIGFARSLLAYPLADGRLKLIDGHLRAAMDPDHLVDVEVLDVTDAEARALLLAIDPLAQLAGYEQETLEELRRLVEIDSAAVRSLWQILEETSADAQKALDRATAAAVPPEQFYVLIECATEAEQLALLKRCQHEGLRCSAKVA
ncbi:MAG: hypothetical protein HY040_01060 [Planctomycetes bacterium]|nr:hypothetical protein [Planctomycetota bacterium]